MGFWAWLRGDRYVAHTQMEFDRIKADLGVTNRDRRKESVGAAPAVRMREMYR